MSWVEIAAGLVIAALGIFHDALMGRPAEFGAQQLALMLAGLLVFASGVLRLSSPRRAGLLAQLGEEGTAGTVAALVLGAALLALGLYAFRGYVVDDSYITYRFARNALASGAPVWNPGERPVEGYSNFLWMGLAALSLSARLDPLAVSKAVSVACLVVAAWLAGRIARRAGGGTLAARLAGVFLLSTPAFVFWAESGLETISVVAFALGWFEALDHDLDGPGWRLRAVAFGTLIVLSRPDAPLFLLVSLVPPVAWGTPAERGRAATLAIALLAAAAPYYAWKLATFGTLIGNTVSAKARPGAGLVLTLDAVRFAAPLLALAASGLVRGASRLERQLWAVFAGWSVVALNVTPHAAHYLRFFLPVLAGLTALAAVHAERLVRSATGARARRVALAAVPIAVCAWLLAPLPQMWVYADAETRGLHGAHRALARALAASYGPHDVLAASDCGVLPYFSGMATVDLWGLTDRRIATRGFDARYVMERHPDAVVLNSLGETRFVPRELYDGPMFEAVQRDTSLALRGRCQYLGYWLWVWSRRPLDWRNSGVARLDPGWPAAVVPLDVESQPGP